MFLPRLLAFSAAAVFFLPGLVCAITAIKMFRAQRRFDRRMSQDDDAYRENVVIRRDDFRDL